MTGFPRIRPVAGHALLVEFAVETSEHSLRQVRALDRALTDSPFPGLAETIPALVNLLVVLDLAAISRSAAEVEVRRCLSDRHRPASAAEPYEVEVCYDPQFSDDLPEVCRRTGLDPESAITTHLSGDYVVAMYGFAPGYAYLSGLPAPLQIARKPVARRAVAAGSVIIAGAQCLVTTVTMPTGWWILGRSPTRILTGNPSRPFLFEPGDRIRFRRVAADRITVRERP